MISKQKVNSEFLANPTIGCNISTWIWLCKRKSFGVLKYKNLNLINLWILSTQCVTKIQSGWPNNALYIDTVDFDPFLKFFEIVKLFLRFCSTRLHPLPLPIVVSRTCFDPIPKSGQPQHHISLWNRHWILH